MKKQFENPSVEVVRFDGSVIATSCACVVAGMEMGADANSGPDCGNINNPECSCGSDLDQNCCSQG